MTPLLIFCALTMALCLVAIAVGLYIEVRQHRELMAARRGSAAGAGVLHLARQVDALQSEVDSIKAARIGGQS